MTRQQRRLITLTMGHEVTGLSVKTLRRYIAAGTLTGYRLGSRAIRLDADEVENLARPIPTVGSDQVA